jgi:hypothetical protein
VSTQIPAFFEREQSVSEADWLRCLPGAVRDHALALPAPGEALVSIGSGTLQLSWTVLQPRRMALIQLPRMSIRYRFDGVAPEARQAFMRYFDLYTHRGGG